MSRNFELLQQIGKDQILNSHTEVQDVPIPVVVPTPSTFKMDGLELEEFTKLAQRTFLMTGESVPRVVVFSGTESGNGCSWICARVAELLASHVAGSVCLVDANLRNPGLHYEFDVENHYGLTDALLKADPVRSFAQPLSRPNLWLVSCGSAAQDCQALVSSDRMRLRLDELRSEFDYVLIDTAAMSLCNDGIMLGRSADGIVLVLKANSSRRETARKAIQDLQSANARVLGAVLNQRTFPIPEALYGKI